MADHARRADVVFVGRVEAVGPITIAEHTPFEGGVFLVTQVRLDLVVEHAVKGVEPGDRVQVVRSALGRLVGPVDEVGELRAIVASVDSGVLVDAEHECWSGPSVDQLLRAGDPAADRGPIAEIVVERRRANEIVGYDVDGRRVVDVTLEGEAGVPAVCPGSERIVLLERRHSDEETMLTIRDLRTLDVIESIDVVTADGLHGLPDYLERVVLSAPIECRSTDGDDVVALVSESSSRNSFVVQIRPDDSGGVSADSIGPLVDAQHDPTSDAIIGVVDGLVVRIDPRRGVRETLGDHRDGGLASFLATVGWEDSTTNSIGVESTTRVAVPDGPTIEPASVRDELPPPERIDSPWITPAPDEPDTIFGRAWPIALTTAIVVLLGGAAVGLASRRREG